MLSEKQWYTRTAANSAEQRQCLAQVLLQWAKHQKKTGNFKLIYMYKRDWLYIRCAKTKRGVNLTYLLIKYPRKLLIGLYQKRVIDVVQCSFD